MPRAEPERTCIVTREAGPPAGLIRFVVGPDGSVVPDLRHKLPGRGAWVTARADLVGQAVKKRLFGRAFKAEVKAPADLAERIDAAMVEDLRGSLSMANKAGLVVSGFAKVETALASQNAAALIHAAEAAPDGRRKLQGTLRAALRKRVGDAIYDFPVIDVLTGDDLDLALGRPNVIHAALVAGAGGDGFLTRWRRLRQYRGAEANAAGDGAGSADETEPAGTRAE